MRESSSDESLEELENPSEDESPTLSFKSLACSLELGLHAFALGISFQIARPTALLGYKPSGGDRSSDSWAPDDNH